MIEHIAWKNTRVEMPDHGITVLVSIAGGSEPVWLAWFEAGAWRDVSSGDIVDGVVVAWADVPEGWFPGVGAA